MKLPRLRLPYLELHIAVPFFSASTQIMQYAFDRDIYIYIALKVRLFKWQQTFRLYRPDYLINRGIR